MPRILLLTCLLALAAPAQAGLRLEGELRMGLVHGPAAEDGRGRISFDSRIRLRAIAEAQTDNGMTYGIVLRLDRDARDARRD